MLPHTLPDILGRSTSLSYKKIYIKDKSKDIICFKTKQMFAAMLLVNEGFILLLICLSLYVNFGPCFKVQIIDSKKNQPIAVDSRLTG